MPVNNSKWICRRLSAVTGSRYSSIFITILFFTHLIGFMLNILSAVQVCDAMDGEEKSNAGFITLVFLFLTLIYFHENS